jgi:CHAT domain-containing protein
LARLALEEANHATAARLLEEATYSAYYFDQYDVLREAFWLGHVVHLVTNQKGAYPPLARAAVWANSKRLDELQATLLIALAEGHAVSGELKDAVAMLSQARRAVGRRDMAESAIGAQLNYVTALIEYLSGDERSGDEALAAALAYQQGGSLRRFHIAAVDAAYVDGQIRERVALELYEAVLSDPSAADWRHDPLDSLSLLMEPQSPALEHWFEAAMKRDDTLTAIDVTNHMRARRFTRTRPLGGRLLALRWILQAPESALPPEAMLQRNDLLGRFPQFAALDKEATAIRQQLRQQPLLPEDAEAAREQGKLAEQLAKIAEQQEKIIRQIAVRREHAIMVFPGRRKTVDIQKQLQPGQAVLVFHVTPQQEFGFLLTGPRHGYWKIASPSAVKEKLAALLRAMGHYDQGRALDVTQLADESWRAAAAELMQEIMRGSKIDLGVGIKELVIVPDGLYWYVPFAALQVGGGPSGRSLLSQTQVRYAPALSFAVPDARGRRQSGDFVVVQGQLFPREDERLSAGAYTELRRILPRPHAVNGPVLWRGSVLATFLDGLIVLDDLGTADASFYDLAPLRVDKGRPGSTLEQWISLPWGGPEVVALPGFHTPAEDSLKRLSTVERPGDDLFLTTMGLLATGTRTILVSRWRPAGRNTYRLLRELLQELPNTSAADAWQRSVEIVHESRVDPQFEPRVKSSEAATTINAKHPFFWSGYLLVDPGVASGKPDRPAEPPKLQFPGVKKPEAN